jgi:hypothetical protein
MEGVVKLYLLSPGERPPFGELAEHLWPGCDFDSDGNSLEPQSTNWTELTLQLRPRYSERVDVDPVSESPLILAIRSATPTLAMSAAAFLQLKSGGRISTQWSSSA